MKTLHPSERAKLLVNLGPDNPLADEGAMLEYATAVIDGGYDLDQLQTLAERTCNRQMLERLSQIPGVDQQRIAGALIVLDVMES